MIDKQTIEDLKKAIEFMQIIDWHLIPTMDIGQPCPYCEQIRRLQDVARELEKERIRRGGTS